MNYSPLNLRLRKFLDLLNLKQLPGCFITDPVILSYYFDLDFNTPDHNHYVLIFKRQIFIFTSPLCQAPQKLAPEISLLTFDNYALLAQKIKDILQKQQIHQLGIDSHLNYLEAIKLLPEHLTLTPINDFLFDPVTVKTIPEQKAISRACGLTTQVYREILAHLKTGVTEIDLVKIICESFYRLGADDLAFPPIVAFGDHTATPHHLPSTRPYRNTDVVLFDFGCKVDGFCSDFTRTNLPQKPTLLQKKAQAAILTSFQKALDSLKSAVHPTSNTLDKIVRTCLDAQGYNRYFIHSLGHGLGKTIHEPPSINSVNQQQLLPGMVITVEPGIYFPGQFGYRHEDTLIITKTGINNLTGR
jgi:Xaa-Pro aminopeptidase